MQPTLLCVHMEPGRLTRVSLLALSLGIQVREVKENEWGQSLSALLGMENMNSHPAPAKVGGEMLVMARFPDQLMDAFLPLLRKQLTPPWPIKAVLTVYNQGWNCGQLYFQLSQEALAFETARSAKK